MYGKTWLEIFGVLDDLFQGAKIQPTLVWAFINFCKACAYALCELYKNASSSSHHATMSKLLGERKYWIHATLCEPFVLWLYVPLIHRYIPILIYLVVNKRLTHLPPYLLNT
jgi:hypothetical protein